jgi:hypothetical protein
MKCLPGKLHQELIDAGVPVISVDENGTVEFASGATHEQILIAHQLVEEHTPVPTVNDLEVSSISQETLIKMVLTLWDKVMNLKDDKDLPYKDTSASKLLKVRADVTDLHSFLLANFQDEVIAEELAAVSAQNMRI